MESLARDNLKHQNLLTPKKSFDIFYVAVRKRESADLCSFFSTVLNLYVEALVPHLTFICTAAAEAYTQNLFTAFRLHFLLLTMCVVL